MRLLITGAAGFVGYHVAKHFLTTTCHDLILIDDFNDYYSVALKRGRQKDLDLLDRTDRITWFEQDIGDHTKTQLVFEDHTPEVVIHLAAQAGVRYSAMNPEVYLHSNVHGFNTILEQAVAHKVPLFLYASSSSVYGSDCPLPSHEDQWPISPVSLYACTKLHNEWTAQLYSQASDTKTIGIRLFNVYGEWGRPDMAYFKWAEKMIRHRGRSVKVFGDGSMRRDMTYIGDVVEAIDKLVDYGLERNAPRPVFNVGNQHPVSLLEIIHVLEGLTGQIAQIAFEPKSDVEVNVTWSDCSLLRAETGYCPETPIETGLQRFVEWFRLRCDLQNGDMS